MKTTTTTSMFFSCYPQTFTMHTFQIGRLLLHMGNWLWPTVIIIYWHSASNLFYVKWFVLMESPGVIHCNIKICDYIIQYQWWAWAKSGWLKYVTRSLGVSFRFIYIYIYRDIQIHQHFRCSAVALHFLLQGQFLLQRCMTSGVAFHVTTYWCNLSPDACMLGLSLRLVIIIVMQSLSLEPITIIVTALGKPVRNIDRSFTILTTGHCSASRYERILCRYTVFRPNAIILICIYIYIHLCISTYFNVRLSPYC